MGGCVTKEAEEQLRDPVVVMKKPRKIPSLNSIEGNHLYKVRVEKEKKEEEVKAGKSSHATAEWCFN